MQGGAILRAAHRMYVYTGYEEGTGLLLDDRPDGLVNPQDRSHSLSSETVDKFISDLASKNISADERLKTLTEQLDMAILCKGVYDWH